jgi:hypothetical protein
MFRKFLLLWWWPSSPSSLRDFILSTKGMADPGNLNCEWIWIPNTVKTVTVVCCVPLFYKLVIFVCCCFGFLKIRIDCTDSRVVGPVQYFLFFFLLQHDVRMLQGMYCVREGDKMLLYLQVRSAKTFAFLFDCFMNELLVRCNSGYG